MSELYFTAIGLNTLFQDILHARGQKSLCILLVHPHERLGHGKLARDSGTLEEE